MQCSVSFDAKPNKVIDGFTYFGFCSYNLDAFGIFHGDESVCVWSNQDCASSDPNHAEMKFYGSTPGISATKPECRCDMVRTGACVSSSDAADRHCAVQEDACGVGYEFVSWRDLESDIDRNPLVCRLCAGLPDTAPAPVNIPDDTALVDNGPLSPAPGPQPSPLKSPADKGKRGLSGGAIVGIIAGAVALAFLLLLAVPALKDKLQSKQDKDDEPNPSMEPGQVLEMDLNSIN